MNFAENENWLAENGSLPHDLFGPEKASIHSCGVPWAPVIMKIISRERFVLNRG
jgi:hypothetical protein